MKKIYITPKAKAVVLHSTSAVLAGSNPDSVELNFSSDVEVEGYAD